MSFLQGEKCFVCHCAVHLTDFLMYGEPSATMTLLFLFRTERFDAPKKGVAARPGSEFRMNRGTAVKKVKPQGQAHENGLGLCHCWNMQFTRIKSHPAGCPALAHEDTLSAKRCFFPNSDQQGDYCRVSNPAHCSALKFGPRASQKETKTTIRHTRDVNQILLGDRRRPGD